MVSLPLYSIYDVLMHVIPEHYLVRECGKELHLVDWWCTLRSGTARVNAKRNLHTVEATRSLCAQIVTFRWNMYHVVHGCATDLVLQLTMSAVQWLTYWVIFAILQSIEVFGYYILTWCVKALLICRGCPDRTVHHASSVLHFHCNI